MEKELLVLLSGARSPSFLTANSARISPLFALPLPKLWTVSGGVLSVVVLKEELRSKCDSF